MSSKSYSTSWQINSMYIVSLVFFILSLMMPQFLIPAIITAAAPLFESGNNEDKKRPVAPSNSNTTVTSNDRATIKSHFILKHHIPTQLHELEYAREIDDVDSEEKNIIISGKDTQIVMLPTVWENSSTSSPTSWLGLGENVKGIAFRTELPHSHYLQKFNLEKVGRVTSSYHLTEFISPVADNPIDEAMGIASASSSSYASSSSSSSSSSSFVGTDYESEIDNYNKEKEIQGGIYSGDIVSFKFSADENVVVKDCYLTVKEDWRLGFAAADAIVDSRCYFTIVKVDEKGEVTYGAPILSGQTFRLRSARWPRYEVGYQLSESSENTGVGNQLLVLYEWSSRPTHLPFRWKFGGMISPLVMSSFAYSLQVSTMLPMPDRNLSIYQKIKSLTNSLSSLFLKPSSRFHVIGWIEMFHRTSKQKQLAFIIVCATLSKDKTIRLWTAIRTINDFNQIIAELENKTRINLKILRKEKKSILKNNNFESIIHSSSEFSTSLKHETGPDSDIRLANIRINNLINNDEELSVHFAKKKLASTKPTEQYHVPSHFSGGVGETSSSSGSSGRKDDDYNPIVSTLSKYLANSQIFDSWFAQGTFEQFGVNLPPPTSTSPTTYAYSAIIVRAIWESHWAEEVVVLSTSSLSFYSPFSKKPSWILSLVDVIGVSKVEDASSPLPGYYVQRVETIDRVHYIAFKSSISRDEMMNSILEKISEAPDIKKNIETQRLFTMLSGFLSRNRGSRSNNEEQNSNISSNFILYSGRWLPSSRRILNGRKFSFDPQSRSHYNFLSLNENYANLSARLLKDSFELDPLSNEDHHQLLITQSFGNGNSNSNIPDQSQDLHIEKLLGFFDDVSVLKDVDLQKMDLQSVEAICFFANIYHTLLIHARLVLSRPTKSEWLSFFNSCCYEIGDNIFSLAELEQCVLRGVLSRQRNMSKFDPIISIPVTDDHFSYAISTCDYRINFLLNSGSISNPNTIFLLTPATLNEQLNKASTTYLNHSINIDRNKHSISLPYKFDLYKDDFGSNNSDVLKKCSKYLIEGSKNYIDIMELINNEANGTHISILFQKMAYDSHPKLALK